ncbi:unnamed protein product [Owenia fusiformis]|uniref:CASPASE_P20 domain-containing protein n=1 Tax=Owenia fusiformis TaxID=6347 RepID=A0A8S4N5G2_OWEFU|nr:unnamed protein product [Owenia fusiformis]
MAKSSQKTVMRQKGTWERWGSVQRARRGEVIDEPERVKQNGHKVAKEKATLESLQFLNPNLSKPFVNNRYKKKYMIIPDNMKLSRSRLRQLKRCDTVVLKNSQWMDLVDFYTNRFFRIMRLVGSALSVLALAGNVLSLRTNNWSTQNGLEKVVLTFMGFTAVFDLIAVGLCTRGIFQENMFEIIYNFSSAAELQIICTFGNHWNSQYLADLKMNPDDITTPDDSPRDLRVKCARSGSLASISSQDEEVENMRQLPLAERKEQILRKLCDLNNQLRNINKKSNLVLLSDAINMLQENGSNEEVTSLESLIEIWQDRSAEANKELCSHIETYIFEIHEIYGIFNSLKTHIIPLVDVHFNKNNIEIDEHKVWAQKSWLALREEIKILENTSQKGEIESSQLSSKDARKYKFKDKQVSLPRNDPVLYLRSYMIEQLTSILMYLHQWVLFHNNAANLTLLRTDRTSINQAIEHFELETKLLEKEIGDLKETLKQRPNIESDDAILEALHANPEFAEEIGQMAAKMKELKQEHVKDNDELKKKQKRKDDIEKLFKGVKKPAMKKELLDLEKSIKTLTARVTNFEQRLNNHDNVKEQLKYKYLETFNKMEEDIKVKTARIEAINEQIMEPKEKLEATVKNIGEIMFQLTRCQKNWMDIGAKNWHSLTECREVTPCISRTTPEALRARWVSYYSIMNPRGVALIISNEPTKLAKGERPGGRHDVNTSRNLFKNLGFDVRVRENLTSNEMTGVMKSLASEYNSKSTSYSLLTIVILTQGTNGKLLDKDGKSVSLPSLLECFSTTNCPALNGRPKLCIIQRCQWSDNINVENIDDVDNTTINQPEETINSTKETLSKNADFAIVEHQLNNWDNLRDEEGGSLFVQIMAEVVAAKAFYLDFSAMFSEVVRLLRARHTPVFPTILSTLTKSLYFFPGDSTRPSP